MEVVNTQNLELVRPCTVEDLRTRINQMNWVDDSEVLHTLISDISSTLVSYDTETKNGKEFHSCLDAIRGLFESYETQGHIDTYKVLMDTPDRSALIISPSESMVPDISRQIVEGITMFKMGNGETIWIDHPIVHFHYDVVKPKGELGGYKTYVDKENGQIFGRGVMDMKATAAVAALLTAKCVKENVPPPVFVITSDEEFGGYFGGTDLLKTIRTDKLTVDWEPIAGRPGTFVDSKSTELSYGLKLDRDITQEEYRRLIQNLYKEFNLYHCGPHAVVQDGALTLSIDGTDCKYNTDKVYNNLYSVALASGIPVSDKKDTRQGIIEGMSSYIDPEVKKIVTRSLEKHFPLEEELFPTQSHLSWSKQGKNGSRSSTFIGGIYTLPFHALQGYMRNIVTIGIHEGGLGRHSDVEAAKLAQYESLLNASFDIINGIQGLNKEEQLSMPSRSSLMTALMSMIR